MSLTKEEVIKKVNEGDTDWFYELYNNIWGSKNGEVTVAYEQSWGDGNDYHIALEFKNLNLSVLLDGTYSSWDSPHWNSVSLSKPYTFTETRYRPVTLDEIRDDKINSVLEESEDKE